MHTLIKLEEAAMFGLGIWLFALLPFNWWWFPALLLTPDLSILGYLLGNKTGAVCYNIFHHKAVAIILFLTRWHWGNDYVQLAGVILLAHSGMDRFFGYGLKTFEGFGFTHLGRIGNNRKV